MELTKIHSKFGGDFLVPSFYGNIDFVPRKNSYRKQSQTSRNENNQCSDSLSEIKSSRRGNSVKAKLNPTPRIPLKDKNIGDCGIISNSKIHSRVSRTSRSSVHYDDQEEQMVTARNTSDFNQETHRQKGFSLNFKLNQLHDRHGNYNAKQTSSHISDHDEAICSDSSDITLERKYTEIFDQSSRPSAPIYKQQQESTTSNKASTSNDTLPRSSESNSDDLKLVLRTLKRMFKSSPVSSRDSGETAKLYQIVKTLQNEQENFRGLISSQQHQLNNFQTKYLKAENVIKSQKYEIQKLNRNNTHLENELNSKIETLKSQLQDKNNELAQFPQAIKNEKLKSEKLSKQNCELITRLQEVKNELAATRAKLVEAAQKRGTTLQKLKASEKDLKIFRNQNNILKTEKRTLIEELKKLKTYNEELTKKSSLNMSRQKERGESQQRQLQKKILDLELELTRSRNSTSDVIEERDKLINELHQQLNTLVHNFEVSQKHIRVLRKHIHSISGSSAAPQQAP